MCDHGQLKLKDVLHCIAIIGADVSKMWIRPRVGEGLIEQKNNNVRVQMQCIIYSKNIRTSFCCKVVDGCCKSY